LWEISTDGFNYTSLEINELCYSDYVPVDKDLWIRVTVTCSSGESKIAWLRVINSDIFRCTINRNMITQEEDVELFKIKPYPNPSYNDISFGLELIDGKKYKFLITNGNGAVIQQGTLLGLPKNNTYSIDVSSLLKGQYFIYLYINEESHVGKFNKL